jgi:hypothetical protein
VDLCLLYAARHDDLLRDAIVSLYWPAIAEGRLTLTAEDAVAFLRQAEADGRIPEPWSTQVKLKIARGLLRAMTDFGLLRQANRTRRETVLYRPSDGAIVYLAYELHLSGATDAALPGHQDWMIFGLHTREVIAEMDRLAGEGWWVVQAAGSVVRITWKFSQLEEVVDALAG